MQIYAQRCSYIVSHHSKELNCCRIRPGQGGASTLEKSRGHVPLSPRWKGGKVPSAEISPCRHRQTRDKAGPTAFPGTSPRGAGHWGVQGGGRGSRVASSSINVPWDRKGILQNKGRAVKNHITGVTKATRAQSEAQHSMLCPPGQRLTQTQTQASAMLWTGRGSVRMGKAP